MKQSIAKPFDANELVVEDSVLNIKPMLGHHALYVGLDVHKSSISVAVAQPGREAPEFRGEIANDPKAIRKLIEKLSKQAGGEVLLICYEAGPCGYGIYHQAIAMGHDCMVVAPSLIPKKAGERIKTDRRDALKLARLLRSGDLTAVWVPEKDQEAMRDLTRARGDMKAQEQKARQQLNAFVLRHGHHWPSNKTRWNLTHYNWLEALQFDDPIQQIVLQEYINATKAASQRVAEMTKQIEAAQATWSLAPVVQSLRAIRGVDTLTATILLAELGDISRFTSPKQLMSFLGLVPNEHSSSTQRRQGGITKAGNGHARRALIESAWCYRFPARMTKIMKQKSVNASDEAKEIAWKAQKRLCMRYRTLVQAGKSTKLVCVAIARELSGFIWDLVCCEMKKLQRAA